MRNKKAEYDTLERFISYFYQIDFVKKIRPRTILEIGIENKTVSNYLKENGFNVETCDINKKTNPDYICDVRKLPFKNSSYDLVMACQILEHIPWEDFNIALKEIHRITKRDVLISLPYASLCFNIVFKFPLMNKIIKKKFVNFSLLLPCFFLKKPSSSDHQWEIGIKKHSLKRTKIAIKKAGFKIVRDFGLPINNYHHFFILEKK
jgi:ubiquinone/menaquinone biosynthesis C-methylase UbiE